MDETDKKSMEIAAIFDKLGKVNITLDNGNDIAFVTCALLQYVTDDRDKAEQLLKLVVTTAREEGTEYAVGNLVEKCEELYKDEVVKLPKFFKPLFTLTIEHFIKHEKDDAGNAE